MFEGRLWLCNFILILLDDRVVIFNVYIAREVLFIEDIFPIIEGINGFPQINRVVISYNHGPRPDNTRINLSVVIGFADG